MAIPLYDRERHRPLVFSYGGLDAGVICLSYAAWTLWQLGYADQALKRGNEALTLAQTLSHHFSLAFAENCFGVLRQFRGEVREAQETAEGVIALRSTDWATTLRGWAIAEQGRSEEGIAQIQEGLVASRATGTEVARPYFLSLLAEACMETGRFDDGLNALTEALAAAEEHENRYYEAEMHRLKGELLLKQDGSNATEAQNCFEQAIEIARKQSGEIKGAARDGEPRATAREAGPPRRGACDADVVLRLSSKESVAIPESSR